LLKDDEWDKLKDLRVVLEPFADYTNQLSGDDLFLSDVLFIADQLKYLFEHLELWNPFQQRILKLMTEKSQKVACSISSIFNSSSPYMKCAWLDPRFTNMKGLLTMETFDLLKQEYNEISSTSMSTSAASSSKKCAPIPQSTSPAVDANENSSSPSLTSPIRVSEKVFLACVNQHAISSASFTLEQEYDAFRKIEGECKLKVDNPLRWWAQNKHRFPKLAKLAAKYFVVLPTEVPCERLFSAAGNILQEKRSTLDAEVMGELLLLHEDKGDEETEDTACEFDDDELLPKRYDFDE